MLTLRLEVVFVLLPLTALFGHVERGASLVCEVLQPLNPREVMEGEVELGEKLDAVKRETLRRIALKEAMVDDLLAGRATLAVVAEEFLILNRSRPELMAIIRATCPGRTDFEKSAHNVVEYASGVLSRLPPAHQARAYARLQAQLRLIDTTDALGVD